MSKRIPIPGIRAFAAAPRAGDHICHYSDPRKMRAHHPARDISVPLDETIRQIVEARRARSGTNFLVF
jgi:CDP-paratose 2-epimerase